MLMFTELLWGGTDHFVRQPARFDVWDGVSHLRLVCWGVQLVCIWGRTHQHWGTAAVCHWGRTFFHYLFIGHAQYRVIA